MRQQIKKLFLLLLLVIILVACNQSNEKKIIGNWKVVEDEEVIGLFEIKKDNLTVRSVTEIDTTVYAYEIITTKDKGFAVEVHIPDSSDKEFLFEGYFDGKDNIKITDTGDGKSETFEMIRIDNAEEEQKELVDAYEAKIERDKARAERREKEKREEQERAQDEEEEELTTMTAEDLYMTSCAACHGADLSGSAGPELTRVGSDYSEEEIKDIIVNGIGNMPGGLLLNPEEIDMLVEWLLEQSS